MAFVPFEALREFQLAEQLSDMVWKAIDGWSYFDKQAIGLRMVRAADSVGANIAEGAGRGTPKDNKRFVRIARGSLNETRFWFRRAWRNGLLQGDEAERIGGTLNDLAPCLNAYLKSIN